MGIDVCTQSFTASASGTAAFLTGLRPEITLFFQFSQVKTQLSQNALSFDTLYPEVAAVCDRVHLCCAII